MKDSQRFQSERKRTRVRACPNRVGRCRRAAGGLIYGRTRRAAATGFASLFYLVPPSTALIAWLLFDERLAGMALVGMALAVWGVYLARK